MHFERESPDDADPLPPETGNRWYFFLPLAMVGLWLVVAAARLVAGMFELTGGAGASLQPSDALNDAVAVMEWVGGLGWVLLFPFYLVVLANKRASSWWVLGAFCCGPNLLLYLGLLLLPSRRRSLVASGLPEPLQADEQLLQWPARRLGNSFVCESCHSLLNYGVSECPECGERYIYADGEPTPDGSRARRP